VQISHGGTSKENPKSEYRNPKQSQNPKGGKHRRKTQADGRIFCWFQFFDFAAFVSYFRFRVF